MFCFLTDFLEHPVYKASQKADGMTGDVSSEVKKDDKETQTPKELVKDFCSYTTTHGVGRLAQAKTLFSRLIWTVFILGAFTMFFFQTYGLFTLYLSRPVSTVVKVKHKTVSKQIVLRGLQLSISTVITISMNMQRTHWRQLESPHDVWETYETFIRNTHTVLNGNEVYNGLSKRRKLT